MDSKSSEEAPTTEHIGNEIRAKIGSNPEENKGAKYVICAVPDGVDGVDEKKSIHNQSLALG